MILVSEKDSIVSIENVLNIVRDELKTRLGNDVPEVDSEEALQHVIDSSLYLRIGDSRGNAVAISPYRALTALHRVAEIETPVCLKDIHGKEFSSVVVFCAFEKDNVDIALLELDRNGPPFDTWTPVAEERVRLNQDIYVVGLAIVANGDAETFCNKCTVQVIEKREGSTLFHSAYYSAQGFSGAGVITAMKSGRYQVVGVHVAAHDSTVGVDHETKPTLKRLASDMVSITSELHGHSAYCLICEIQRVGELVTYLSSC